MKSEATDEHNWLVETTQSLHNFQSAVNSGFLRFDKSQANLVEEIMRIEILPGQLIKKDIISREAIGFIRTAGMALRLRNQQNDPALNTPAPLSLAEGQYQLFGHFAEVFASVTGRAYDVFPSFNEVVVAAKYRAASETKAMLNSYERAVDRLQEFYKNHTRTLWQQVSELGGLKLVLGGQRLFGPSAFAGFRKMSLYADTQLIADPIFPFFEHDLGLKAKHISLIEQLYHLLQLSPLVNARLPVPPVMIFPSLEKTLEDNDVRTQVGILDLVLRTVNGAGGQVFSSPEELRNFAFTQSDRFASMVMDAQLFIPPGAGPGEYRNPEMAVKKYIDEIRKTRAPEVVSELEKLPLGGVLLNGVLERFSPQYHLLENASELTAQPMLTQKIHWYYFEKAASATATDFFRKDILSEESHRLLHALQHKRLTWLADIPMPALAELLENQENLEFRRELDQHTRILSFAGQADIDRTVKEVCHAIDSMVQKHHVVLQGIEEKYGQKYGKTWLTGGAGMAVGVGAMFMPMLAAFPPIAPIVAMGGIAGKLVLDKIDKSAEVKKARSNLLGVLASASNI